MTATFALDIINAETKEELTRVLAEYRVVPKKNPMASLDVAKSDYTFERRGEKVGGSTHAFGTQTRKSMVKKLEIESDYDCERVREKIKNHPRWGKYG